MSSLKATLTNIGNAHERKARLEKVLHLFMSVLNFASASAEARKSTATLLRTWSQSDRDTYACACGQLSPSMVTWEMFCQMVEGS